MFVKNQEIKEKPALADQLREMIHAAIASGKFKNASHLAEFAGVDQGTLSKYLTGKSAGMSLANASRLMDALGAEISCPTLGSETAREVCFVDAKVLNASEEMTLPDAEDYFAVPLVEEVGAGAGIIPQGELLSWLLVWRWQKSIANRSSNLIAVRLDKKADSMLPVLHPEDIVLIDRNERRVEGNGRLWLVLDPLDGSGKIKRVATKSMPEDKDTRITYYSDNPEYPPESYSLRNDFFDDWNRCIAGRVIWAWSDVSNK